MRFVGDHGQHQGNLKSKKNVKNFKIILIFTSKLENLLKVRVCNAINTDNFSSFWAIDFSDWIKSVIEKLIQKSNETM